jgi:L,D-transpeptidase catalytic domain
MIELFLSLNLICNGTDCVKVATGPDTKPGTYTLKEWSVPQLDRKRYGNVWYQIGNDENWGIHGYPNFGTWMVSHGCVRVGQMAKVASWNPTSIRIVK